MLITNLGYGYSGWGKNIYIRYDKTITSIENDKKYKEDLAKFGKKILKRAEDRAREIQIILGSKEKILKELTPQVVHMQEEIVSVKDMKRLTVLTAALSTKVNELNIAEKEISELKEELKELLEPVELNW